MVRSTSGRRVALTTGGIKKKTLRLTHPSGGRRSSTSATTKPDRKSKPKSVDADACDLCSSRYRTRMTAVGKRCFDCWREHERLVALWSAVPHDHSCAGAPSRATCSSSDHRKFYMVASSLANRSRNDQIDIAHILRSAQSRALEVAEQNRATALKKQERKQEAAAQRQAARAKAKHEQQERARKAEITRKEARACQLMSEIRSETPIEDLREAMSKLQGRWNER